MSVCTALTSACIGRYPVVSSKRCSTNLEQRFISFSYVACCSSAFMSLAARFPPKCHDGEGSDKNDSGKDQVQPSAMPDVQAAPSVIGQQTSTEQYPKCSVSGQPLPAQEVKLQYQKPSVSAFGWLPLNVLVSQLRCMRLTACLSVQTPGDANEAALFCQHPAQLDHKKIFVNVCGSCLHSITCVWIVDKVQYRIR